MWCHQIHMLALMQAVAEERMLRVLLVQSHKSTMLIVCLEDKYHKDAVTGEELCTVKVCRDLLIVKVFRCRKEAGMVLPEVLPVVCRDSLVVVGVGWCSELQHNLVFYQIMQVYRDAG